MTEVRWEFPPGHKYAQRCQCDECLAEDSRRKRAQYRADLATRREAKRTEKRSVRSRTKNAQDKAAQTIRIALRSGKLKKPTTCEECGVNPGVSAKGYSLVFAHIPDPSDPWTHEWLCSLCSGKRRQRFTREEPRTP